MPVITSSHGEDEDWVAFETNCAFKAERRKARVESNRQPTGPSSRSSPSNASSASWMNKPINNDESWMPVAPPVVEARDAPERNRRDTSVERPSLSRNRDPPSIPSRYKSSIRRAPPRSPMSNKPMPIVSSVHDHISAETGTNPASSSSDSSSTESGDKAPCAQSRGLSDDRFIPKAPRVRGRSSSRTREPPDSNVRSSSRAREPSSIPPPSSRGRSSSRTRQPLLPSQSPTAQSTSSDRRTSLSPHSVANSPRRGFGSRPPVTSATRGRSLANSSPVARDRSTSKTRASRRSSSNNAGPGLPPRPPGANGSGNTLDANIGRNITFGVTNDISDVAATTADCRSGLMGRLFGDQTDGRQSPSHRATSLSLPDRILPRTLLSATVYHNTASNLWITTINTNQKGVATNPKTASKYLKAFSFPTERQARESAIANAPPKMIAFSKAPNCFICLKNFAMFKRAGHCRNCGVCVCNSCTTPWPSTSIPETYNLKKESKVKICNSCNKLSMDFKQALLHGKYDNVIELYNTGNVNLRTPFPVRSKEESMHPIHCAVDGGNIRIVRWLIEERFCPIKKTATTKNKSKRPTEQPIMTSKGRTALGIAMHSVDVDILRYLVVERNVPVYETKDLTVSLRALEAALLALPQRSADGPNVVDSGVAATNWDDDYFSEDSNCCSSLGEESALLTLDSSTVASRAQSEQTATDVCIICYDNHIDCVITPCGHQICCLQCSENMKCCPVCNSHCNFIKIFRP